MICENTITKILFACLVSNNAYVKVKISYREISAYMVKELLETKMDKYNKIGQTLNR